MHVEFIRKNGVLTMSLDYHFFCVEDGGIEPWGAWAVLVMENTATMRFVQNEHGAVANLWLTKVDAANVRGGMIVKVPSGEGFNEPVTEPNDLRQWLRQLGRIPVEGSPGSLDVFRNLTII